MVDNPRNEVFRSFLEPINKAPHLLRSKKHEAIARYSRATQFRRCTAGVLGRLMRLIPCGGGGIHIQSETPEAIGMKAAPTYYWHSDLHILKPL